MRNTIKMGLFLLSLFGTWYFFHSTSEKNSINKLMLENIEALANNEVVLPDHSFSCFGDGDIDCYGDKVESRFDYNR